MPTEYETFESFLSKVKLNTVENIDDLQYLGLTDPAKFARYSTDDPIPKQVYQLYSKSLIEFYIKPIIEQTGFKFVVRDFRKGGRRTKKINFQFICSQDRSKQRKSRSNNQRRIQNRLKVQDCDSRINLKYSMTNGQVSISFTHRTHVPYSARHQTPPDIPTGHVHDAVKSEPNGQDGLEFNSLQRLAHYNCQFHHHSDDSTTSTSISTTHTTDSTTAQEAVAIATQKLSEDKMEDKMENIDKELIGLQQGSI